MHKAILQPEVQEFISKNLKTDLPQLILKGSPFNKISIQALASQIESKRKAENKIPYWFATENILYPKSLNLEQTSSEITARHKANQIDGKRIIDLTGGFGIDSFFFAEKFEKVTHCELNEQLSAIAKHNFQYLSSKKNIEFYAGNGIDFLKNATQMYDWVYIDPSRRDHAGGRVFQLRDCEPDIISHLEMILQHVQKGILMKTSPLLDLSLGLKELNFQVQEIQVIAVNNDVKELLWKITSEKNTQELPITAINFNKNDKQVFKADFFRENSAQVQYSEPKDFLYEPNSTILKAGFFNLLAQQFQLQKIAPHSHLYTSEECVNFPGRTFKVEKSLPFQKKNFKKAGINKANITTRNFPLSVDQIRKKLNIKEGGSIYLFFTTNLNNEKIILICKKV
ncbi:class I SAM-dependent methyltransferase [Mesonia sp. JHPTF-M18]|uniref:Class I SAM-dependent methyltransferase n=1 Tax=Mesonia aestuariivivens TaxID=2796128 RepID=A0ABS6W119_9FLAO|nr:class I SAM-dependent methyltransferase [Mesonia aestuariivivens]MBW2960809.1 class I SAM-dependent methyltransferase [Mesonia aestuariivivens]